MDYPDSAHADSAGPPPPDPNDPRARRRRAARDTVIMSNVDAFAGLGLKDMPRVEYLELAELIGRNFGIKVDENKITLVTGRIHPMMEKYSFASHRDCLEAIKRDSSGQLLSELANRISTNHTAFYREEAHFALLRDKVLPDLVQRKTSAADRDIRIWCAACATGEEAYTILFILLKFFHFDYHNWRAGVLATDISAAALDVAKRGVYSKQRLEPVPRDILNLYLEQADSDNYAIKPELREEMTFRRLNLITESYPFRQPFDIIFCRNVMIYFSRGVRLRLLQHLHDWLVPGGCLFIGHSESLVGHQEGFESIAPAVYRRLD